MLLLIKLVSIFSASSLRFSQPFMLLISRPQHHFILENTASIIHSSELYEYVANDIYHAGHPFAFTVAFELK